MLASNFRRCEFAWLRWTGTIDFRPRYVRHVVEMTLNWLAVNFEMRPVGQPLERIVERSIGAEIRKFGCRDKHDEGLAG